MKQDFRKRMLSLGLLLSLSIPFVINSLHFILFEHHIHDYNFSVENKLVKNEKTHLICQWEFAIEEIVSTDISIKAPFISKLNLYLFNDRSVVVPNNRYFFLRGPPKSIS
jgi:hypothetical protein